MHCCEQKMHPVPALTFEIRVNNHSERPLHFSISAIPLTVNGIQTGLA